MYTSASNYFTPSSVPKKSGESLETSQVDLVGGADSVAHHLEILVETYDDRFDPRKGQKRWKER
jgi:hypothetical protein